MNTAQFSLAEIKSLIRRRKILLIVPPIIVTAICVYAAFTLPRKYESYTTIWVQADEILNPLVSYTMAVQMASVDRLATFREIVYSRKTIEAVIDSLKMAKSSTTPIQWDELIEAVRRNISTARRSSDSFTISYVDEDPVRAQKAASLLARLFIFTRLRGEATRNAYTVQFFEGKLKEYQGKFEDNQQEIVALMLKRMKERPAGSRGLTSKYEATDQEIEQLKRKAIDYQEALYKLSIFPDAFHTDQGRQALSELRRMDLPYVDELRIVMSQYDDVTSRYTSRYPEVGKVENQLLEVLRRMRVSVQSQIADFGQQLDGVRTSRNQIFDELMKVSVDEQMDLDKNSNYGLYKKLFEDMKMKLEQAKTAMELGKTGENSFIIIDPAGVPAKPTKPNRPLIIFGGLGLGIVLGIGFSLAAELLDTRIRTVKDVEVYQLPVIALLPEIRVGK